MLAYYGKAFIQTCLDHRVRKPILYSFGLAMLTTLLLLPVGYFCLEWLNETLMDWINAEDSWLLDAIQWSLRVLGWLIGLTFFVFVFGLLQTAYLSMFIDQVIEAATELNRPGLTLYPPPTLRASAWSSARFLALSFFVNLLIMPIVLVGWILPPLPLGLIVQLIANGYLLGKEFEDLVANRFPSRPKISLLRRTTFGMVSAGLLLVPFVNFCAPVITAAAFTNYYSSRE
tara:strand:- start:450 stop:1139 length:690 start_codon:yes stop_codon:yes gene_type:complete